MGTRDMRVEDIVILYDEVSDVRAKHDNRKAKQREGDSLGRRGELASGQWRVNTLCLPHYEAGFCRR